MFHQKEECCNSREKEDQLKQGDWTSKHFGQTLVREKSPSTAIQERKNSEVHCILLAERMKKEIQERKREEAKETRGAQHPNFSRNSSKKRVEIQNQFGFGC